MPHGLVYTPVAIKVESLTPEVNDFYQQYSSNTNVNRECVVQRPLKSLFDTDL